MKRKMLDLIDSVQRKIAKEYSQYVEELKKMKKVDIINKAYEIAHYNEVIDFFDEIDEEYPPFDGEIFENILKSEEKILNRIFGSWLNYSHPERYNFFCYEDLVDIICWEFKN